jgi:hypothetical protein
MDIQSALKHQYHAALKTLRLAVEQCPPAAWDQADGNCAPFWRVAYHTLFFTHFYLQQDRSQLKPWEKHRRGVEGLGNPGATPYSRDEILEYWRICDGMIDAGIDKLDLSAPQCGFPWYKMPTLEHQLVNIRHIQHHAAMLAARLRSLADISIDWVGRA